MKKAFSRPVVFGLACALAWSAWMLGCSSSSSGTSAKTDGGGGSSGGTPTSGTIGASGGTVTSSDGRVTLDVPPGALGSDTSITIAPSPSPPGGAAGPVYEIGPTGTRFATPAKLTFTYQSGELGPTGESGLSVITYESGAWTAVPTAIDAAAKKVTGTVQHLSPWSFGYASVSGHCAASGDPVCGAGCQIDCSGATPFAICIDSVNDGNKLAPPQCISPASCTCSAKSTCAIPDGTCAGCTVTCDPGATPYAVCKPGQVSTDKSAPSSCTSPASCTCSASEPTVADAGATDASAMDASK